MTLRRRRRFDAQPYLTEAGINLPVMRRGVDATRWRRYDGTGVQFIQIEGGWNVRHEAFNDHVRAQKPGRGFEDSRIDHGNKVLGIVLANGAASRIRGIARNCTLKGLYAVDYTWQPRQQLEKRIRLATRNLAAGDVMLLAMQGDRTLLPVEVTRGVFRAIRAATSKGIIVIEAAGNQGRPLEDALSTPRHAPAWKSRKRIPRFHGLPDSGAIIVGGCWVPLNDDGDGYDQPVQDRYTRSGPRVDCCAWSRGVYSSAGTRADYGYFHGTSAAASAIAGLALLLQQCAKERLGRPLTPREMRDLFRDPRCGTEVMPTEPNGSIRMPDAMKLFKRLKKLSN